MFGTASSPLTTCRVWFALTTLLALRLAITLPSVLESPERQIVRALPAKESKALVKAAFMVIWLSPVIVTVPPAVFSAAAPNDCGAARSP